MWHRLAPVSWYLRRLERAVERAVGLDPEGIDVVCHSMGGVLLRSVLARRPDLARRIRRVVTLGSPHRGTAAARGIPWLPEVQALKRRSAFLAGLPSLSALVPRAVTVAGTLDTIVYPVDTALEDGAEHVVIPAGHAGLLTRPEAVAAVRHALVRQAS
jgi:pimeloyl-ACP methyl ester carboxylesterase